MKVGRIEVITGCMFSGKSEELIRRLKRAQIAKQRVQAFKHSIDNRYSVSDVASHSGERITATPIKSASEILANLDIQATTIGIDEAQFFENEIVDAVKEIALGGKRVIIAGLDMDFRGEPFGPMPFLMAIADEVLKLHAICAVC